MQRLPSSAQRVPIAVLVMMQPPLPSQLELAWQFVAIHAYAVPPQTPPVQTSLLVQVLLSLHAVPFALSDQARVAVAGVQT